MMRAPGRGHRHPRTVDGIGHRLPVGSDRATGKHVVGEPRGRPMVRTPAQSRGSLGLSGSNAGFCPQSGWSVALGCRRPPRSRRPCRPRRSAPPRPAASWLTGVGGVDARGQRHVDHLDAEIGGVADRAGQRQDVTGLAPQLIGLAPGSERAGANAMEDCRIEISVASGATPTTPSGRARRRSRHQWLRTAGIARAGSGRRVRWRLGGGGGGGGAVTVTVEAFGGGGGATVGAGLAGNAGGGAAARPAPAGRGVGRSPGLDGAAPMMRRNDRAVTLAVGQPAVRQPLT